MKRAPWLIGGVSSAVVLTVAVLLVGRNAEEPVRILYPHDNVLAVGQIGRILEETDILERRGVEAVVRGVRLAELSRDEVHAADVVLNGQGAPLKMIGDGYRGRVVGTLGLGGRLALMTAADSGIEQVAGLKDRAILGMRMNALHTALIGWLRRGGLEESAVRLVNYDKQALSAADVAARDDVAAVVAWDPMLEELATEHGYRVLAWGEYHTTILFSERLLSENPELARRTMLALLDAAAFMSRDHQRANAWFREHHPVDAQLLDRVMQHNHLYRATGPDQLVLNAARTDFSSAMRSSVQFLEKRGRVPAGLTYLDVAPMRSAEALWRREVFELNQIREP